MLRKGEVRVNKGRIKAEYRLKSGDIVRIPPVRMTPIETQNTLPKNLHKRLSDRVLYEDSDLLVFNKPCGLAVHGGTGLSYGLIEALRELRPDDRYLELVHRLDRDTSGCLLIAKKRSTLKYLHELFRSDKVKKRYSVLLSGVLERKKIVVDAALRKNIKKSGEWMVEISELGKDSRTSFIRKRTFSNATWVEAQPKTGRTHQIRVHAASIGLPVAGDVRYGDKQLNRMFRSRGLQRLFLHASYLGFEHPKSGNQVSINAPLDAELVNVIENLENEKDL